MWINLTRNDVDRIVTALAAHTAAHPDDERVNNSFSHRLLSSVEDAFDRANQAYVDEAKVQYQRDGEVEIDEQADGSACVSVNDEGGAYVLAWVYVKGKPEEEEEEE